jgi:hypothetical protein
MVASPPTAQKMDYWYAGTSKEPVCPRVTSLSTEMGLPVENQQDHLLSGVKLQFQWPEKFLMI